MAEQFLAEEAIRDAERRKSLRPLSRLFPYLLRRKFHVGGAVFFLLLAAATTLTLPLAVRRMVDHGFSGRDSGFINDYFTMLVVIAGVLAIASACRYYFVIWLGERVIADLRADVFRHITRLSPEFFDVSHSGEIVSRLTADTTQIKSAVGATASMALRNTLLGIGALIMMTYTSPRLSLIVIAAIPLIVLPLVGIGREVRRRSRLAQNTLAIATAYASEAIGAIRTVQAYSNASNVAEHYCQAAESAFDAARASTAMRALLTAFAIFMIFSSVVTVLWIGARDVLAGDMSPGNLGQFLFYSVFAAGALGALSEVWGELSQAAGAAERLTELMAVEPQIAAPKNPTKLPLRAKGEITFEAVGFAYPSRPATKVLCDFTLTIQPGETIAVVGPSGAGKSTLFSLLLRFYDPQSGSIELDGIDLRDTDPDAFRRHIALVPQETSIFGTSIADNIRFADASADANAVRRAAEDALATEFIDRMQHGFDEMVGERGVTLSGGQRQRIAIARAILKNAPVLLLDEATSALDAESEKLVQEALARLMVGRTTIVIAHRLATVLKADRIIVLDNGRIVEEGTHQTLVAKGGQYANLARLQFDTGAGALDHAGNGMAVGE